MVKYLHAKAYTSLHHVCILIGVVTGSGDLSGLLKASAHRQNKSTTQYEDSF